MLVVRGSSPQGDEMEELTKLVEQVEAAAEAKDYRTAVDTMLKVNMAAARLMPQVGSIDQAAWDQYQAAQELQTRGRQAWERVYAITFGDGNPS